MKKRLTISLMVLAVSVFSCSKDEELPVGGRMWGEIYILENSELKEAHKAVIEVPAEAGSTDLVIVSYGLRGADRLGGSAEISIECEKMVYPPTAEIYKAGQLTQYKQSATIKYSENTKKKDRKAVFEFYADGLNGFKADLTVVQSKKK